VASAVVKTGRPWRSRGTKHGGERVKFLAVPVLLAAAFAFASARRRQRQLQRRPAHEGRQRSVPTRRQQWNRRHRCVEAATVAAKTRVVTIAKYARVHASPGLPVAVCVLLESVYRRMGGHRRQPADSARGRLRRHGPSIRIDDREGPRLARRGATSMRMAGETEGDSQDDGYQNDGKRPRAQRRPWRSML